MVEGPLRQTYLATGEAYGDDAKLIGLGQKAAVDNACVHFDVLEWVVEGVDVGLVMVFTCQSRSAWCFVVGCGLRDKMT